MIYYQRQIGTYNRQLAINSPHHGRYGTIQTVLQKKNICFLTQTFSAILVTAAESPCSITELSVQGLGTLSVGDHSRFGSPM